MITQTQRESSNEKAEPDPGPRPRTPREDHQEENLVHETTYLKDHVAAFMRSRERYGDLSNMTHGYPLAVNELTFQGPEGLYQALKFPQEPRFQELIGTQKSGMDAKKTAYRKTCIRPDWEEVKLDAMRFTLAAKLLQHPKKFREALMETGTWPIVEMSMRDEFWGAKPRRSNTVLVGANLLGKLLSKLREELWNAKGDPRESARAYIQNTNTARLIINNRPVTPTNQATQKGT